MVKNMCGISSTKTINIGQPPPLNISISVAGAPACFGNTVSLTSSVNGGIPPYTYNWNTGSTLSSITVTPSIMPTTVYTLNVTDSQGCFAPKSLSVAVNPVPSITVTPFNPTICDGKTASVNLSGALNYTTNPGGITVSSFTVNPSSTTIYTITGISPQGCFGFRNDTIKVNNLPPIFSNVNTNTVCLGSSVTFSNSGGLTYTLNPSSINGNIINVIPTVLGTTIFTVSGSGPFGCINTKTINITTFALPNVSISPANPTICSGKSIVLSGLGASTYTWSGTGSSGSSITVSPTANSTFSLIGTNSFGCINSASTIVNVIPTPIVSINSPTNVCFGYTMNIVASGATNYLWSNGATTDSIHVQPFSNITYNVIGNNGGSCSDTAFISLSVLPLPPVTASVNTTLACVGQTINLTASGAVNYLWKPNNFIGPNQTVQIFVPTTYTVYGKGSNGCAFFSTVSVNVKTGTSIIPVSTPSAVCIGDTSILSVIGGYVPLWSNNPIPNTTIATPTTNTSYTLSAIDFNGCTSDIVFYVGINADCDVVVFNSFTPNGDGINDFFSIDNIDKYPNNMVYIYNRWGNKIFNTTNYNNSNNNWDGKLNGKVVTAGTYFYIIVNENEKVFKKGWIEITN
jgi:gliding motility-associated-like protein